ncbi:helix-turn-helix domain-containing protein [Kaistia defluvii]|uniref:Helix-turn-helix domain-containing protein n=1 Tax=Kaistia defluvii TaxID=410841 RepID=A0ABV2R4G4_9HYPH
MSGPRYSIIPADAVTDNRLEGRDLQVLALLGRHTNDGGWCSRSQVKMAREIHCGRATIQRGLARLIECGYVQQRAMTRKDGGDRAHEYRVLLDEVRPDSFINDGDESDASAASETEGVPTGGQGVPTQDGQGVPTHERAPIRTTLLKRNERETRALGADIEVTVVAAEADTAFMAWLMSWPTAASDSLVRTYRAWIGLTEGERAEAVDRTAASIAQHQGKVGRKGCYASFTYLEEKRWKRLPSGAVATASSPARILVKPRGLDWCVVFWRRRRAGERVKTMFDMGMTNPELGYGVAVADLPTDGERASLVKIATWDDARRTTPEMAAWGEELAREGISFTPHDLRTPFIWVPSRWPPGREGNRLAATGDEARQ